MPWKRKWRNARVARRLMTHPGVGALTALVFELVIGTPQRFPCGKQIASYVGLVPAEESSGERRRLGHISKQGNVLLRFLLVEAAQGPPQQGHLAPSPAQPFPLPLNANPMRPHARKAFLHGLDACHGAGSHMNTGDFHFIAERVYCNFFPNP